MPLLNLLMDDRIPGASRLDSAMRPPPATVLEVPTLLRWCLHLLVTGLLLLVALRAVLTSAPQVGWIVVLAGVVGAVYALGTRLPAVSRSTAAAAVWLGGLLVCWIALLVLTPDAIYLAFAWFLLILHLLARSGTVVVVLTAVLAIGGFAWHQQTWTAAMVIGPLLGAGVAIATVRGYQSLHHESEQRRLLIAELERTRADLAAAERQAGVLAERERLAREIHDTLAQGLSSIQLLLRAAGREQAGAGVDGRTADLIEQARQTAQDNLVEARRFVEALTPAGLQRSSLEAALHRLCDTTSRLSGIDTTFRQEGTAVRLETPMEVALLRIAQAALSNTVQHARAGRADITLTYMDSSVNLDIVDDGIGLGSVDRQSPEHQGGFGLLSMRSRAAELGGTLTVESEEGQGTAVAVCFAFPGPGESR